MSNLSIRESLATFEQYCLETDEDLDHEHDDDHDRNRISDYVSLEKYIERLVRILHMEPSTVDIGIRIVHHVIRHRFIYAGNRQYYIWLIALFIAHKLDTDIPYSNKYISQKACILVEDLNAMELELLLFLNFDLYRFYQFPQDNVD